MLRQSLEEILLGREAIAREMQELLYEATDPWGVTVERVEVGKTWSCHISSIDYVITCMSMITLHNMLSR